MRCFGTAMLLAVVFGINSTFGLSFIPRLWEQIVEDADFVGIVECKTAGEMVAKYKVVDSWKGAANDEEILIRITPDPMGKSFRTVLCGEKLLVAAFRAKKGKIETMYNAEFPIWWRNIEPDYYTEIIQGIYKLNWWNDTRRKDFPALEEIKRKTQDFLKQADSERELQLLFLEFRKSFLKEGQDVFFIKDKALTTDEQALKEEFQRCKTVEEFLVKLFGFEPKNDDEQRMVQGILSKGGRAETLRFIQSKNFNYPHFQEVGRDAILDIERRLRIGREISEDVEPPPAEGEIDKMRKNLEVYSQVERWDYLRAIRYLTKHEPARVLRHLLAWKMPSGKWKNNDMDYLVGSYFACYCPADRKSYLVSLFRADNEYIRVAAGVYLCFEDEERGMKRLREMMKLEGDPGVWAAFTLMRRGEKDAAMRGFQVFEIPGYVLSGSGESSRYVPDKTKRKQYPGDGYVLFRDNHCTLQKRILILLSNSCTASGIPFADISYEFQGMGDPLRGGYGKLLYWWNQNMDKITLYDPWLDELKKKKVD